MLITGSTQGIGSWLARAFARHGAHVAVHGLTHVEDGKRLVDELKALGSNACLVLGDLSYETGPAQIVDDAARQLGGLDVYISNAGGIIRRSRIDAFDLDLYNEVMALNVRATLLGTKAAIPHLKASGGGSIIFTSSKAHLLGGGLKSGAAAYAGAKSFIVNFTKTTAREFAEDGIRANCVSPGTFATPTHSVFATEEQLEALRQTIPLGRLGNETDAVGPYLFFASDMLSGYITGQALELNGGELMPS
ncbi:3-oxoacyl-[acyl-carrier protein] reductase [Neorhizobium galegae]|uniref:SDR family NAD(P)-dependent oxidoreductase n=1 Tax=Neorhizobium galegae TaxID=399 RepID=UPI00277DE58E|nr:SDR family oxidoreductase [Neorhizobium galegae]MDQ0137679.1 3-oxoacyl-[acyl-carrier protein] reductase [Neorhizobium galegae]